MNLAKIPDFSCNLQNPLGRKFWIRKRGHVRENRTYGMLQMSVGMLRMSVEHHHDHDSCIDLDLFYSD